MRTVYRIGGVSYTYAMPRAATLAKLDQAIAAKSVARLALKGNIGSAPFGVPVYRSEELLVLVELNDFRTDGYIALPVKRVSKVRLSRFEYAYEKLCAAEGLTPYFAPPDDVNAESFVSLFASLRRLNHYSIVESHEQKDGDDINTFSLGPVTGLSDGSVSLHHFDAEGQWDPKPTTIPFDRILHVQWRSRYIDVWQRHITPRESQ